jgi:hypothetical protein
MPPACVDYQAWREPVASKRSEAINAECGVSNDNHDITASCRCGHVAFEITGRPILSVVCHCHSCQEAGGKFELLAGAQPVLDANGGTGFVLVRKDRIRSVRGSEKLQEHRLKPDSPTRRVLASCCNSPMFLEFNKGHWLSIYRDRLPDGAAPLEMRVMTRDKREGVELPNDIPNYSSHSARFMWKLLSAWAAMGFRAPKVAP